MSEEGSQENRVPSNVYIALIRSVMAEKGVSVEAAAEELRQKAVSDSEHTRKHLEEIEMAVNEIKRSSEKT